MSHCLQGEVGLYMGWIHGGPFNRSYLKVLILMVLSICAFVVWA